MAARDDFDTALVAVVTALGTSDFTTARAQARIARVHALRLPVSFSADGVSTTERAVSEIDSILADIDAGEARASKSSTISVWVPQ